MVHHLLPLFKSEGRNWIVSQRDHHRPRGRSLDGMEERLLSPFFRSETLATVRLRVVEEIENPPLYRELEARGIPIPLDFREASGITFIDTVLLAPSAIVFDDEISVVFHECVHVVQYLILGVDEFVNRYIDGWASGGFDYFMIPLEQEAERLQFRFDRHRYVPFSVEDTVAEQLR